MTQGSSLMTIGVLVCLAALAGPCNTAAQEQNANRNSSAGASALPEAAGKDVVVRVCSQCHNLERIANTKRTARQWKAMAELMAARSTTPPSAAELRGVIDY